ncbi:MAG: replication initiation factor domain-containing protein [Nitrospirae bacterium]|nr:replication initiation factor domain-containing protein [Nitrospirota bacterium]
MDDRIFTATIDWLAFTVPQATVEEMSAVVGGDWFETTTGFRGYPTCWLTNQGRHGVGKLGTGAHRNAKEVHVDLSAGIVSTWDEAKIRSVLAWIFAREGHITRMDVALDDRAALVSIAQVKQAVGAGQAVTRSQKFQVIAGSSLRNGSSTGDTLYFGSRESQTMLRVYDKRLELEQKDRAEAKDYGVRWELELKKDRAQACAKALLTLEPDDWREFLVGVLRSYVDFRETTHEAEPWEKYRAPLLSWWASLTEGFKRCRLVVEKVQQTLDDVCQWLGQSISAMLALAYCRRGEAFLRELIYAGSKKWKARHLAMLNEGRSKRPYVLRPI